MIPDPIVSLVDQPAHTHVVTIGLATRCDEIYDETILLRF